MENNQSAKVFGEKSQKMTLKGYYEGLPKRTSPKTEFISKVIAETGKSFPTVMNWIQGKFKPESKEDVEALSRLTGIPAENLW